MLKAFQGFRKTIRENCLALISISIMAAIIFVVYWQDLSVLFNEALQSEAVGHIVLIPFLVSYLVYRKKELVKASLALEGFRGETRLVPVKDIVGISFCLIAFLVYWYGSYTFYPLVTTSPLF